MQYEKSCGAVVINEDHQFLIIRQVQGHWCFPKGHVEGSESEEETAKREILEETGYRVRILDGFRYTLSYSPCEGVMKEVVYFAAELLDGAEKNQEEEVSEITWKKKEDVRELVTYDNDKALFEAAVTFFEKRAEC